MATNSLADQAVAALSAVGKMDADVTNEHDERHQIRSLKSLAEQVLGDAFAQARRLAYLAEDLRRDANARRAAPPIPNEGSEHGKP